MRQPSNLAVTLARQLGLVEHDGSVDERFPRLIDQALAPLLARAKAAEAEVERLRAQLLRR